MDDDSFESSAFHGSRESLSRFKSINPLGMSVESTATADPLGQRRDSTSSDQASTIPELTRAEEMQIKRNSALFPPIQQNEGGSQRSAGSFLDSWRPSSDIMVAIEGATGPRVTRNWNDEGLDVSHDGNRPPIDVIPSHVRGSTPDSVASSGRFRILGDSGRHRDIDAGNLQRPAQGLGTTTRGIVSRFQFDNLGAIPDSETGNPADNFELRPSSRDRQELTDPTEYTKREKKTRFAPRALLLILFLACLIGAVVALISTLRKSTSGNRGIILPDPISTQECTDKVFELGDDFEFECTPADHEFRKPLKDALYYRVTKHGYATLIESVEIQLWNGSSSTTLHYKPGGKVKCSTEGIYNVTFYDASNVTIKLEEGYKMSLRVSVNASEMNVALKQVQRKDDILKSDFAATCSIAGDCNQYKATYFRSIYNVRNDITHLANCTQKFNDTHGNSLNCTGMIPDDMFGNYIHFFCKMEAKRDDGRTISYDKPFKLPGCAYTQECKVYQGYGPGPFNCTDKSSHREELNAANCTFAVLENCFKDRPIFLYYKNATRQITDVKSNTTKPVCRLGWCRNYEIITKLEIPGVAICGSGYSEPEAPVPQ